MGGLYSFRHEEGSIINRKRFIMTTLEALRFAYWVCTFILVGGSVVSEVVHVKRGRA